MGNNFAVLYNNIWPFDNGTYQIGDLLASPRYFGLYDHWIIITAVNNNGELMVVDKQTLDAVNKVRKSITKKHKTKIIYGHTTFIRRLKKGDSEESRAIFDHAIRECTLRYVLNKLILFAKNHYIVYNIT